MLGDGPGIRTTVFLKGCGLRCIWCSSPQTQGVKPDIVFKKNKCIACWKCEEVCPSEAINSDFGAHRIRYDKCTSCQACVQQCSAKALIYDSVLMSAEHVFNVIKKDADYYNASGGGVTLSGGEPTLQPNFAAAIARLCKENGIHVNVETCSYSKWEDMKRVLQYADMVFCDIKHMDADTHRILTGQSNERILTNIRKISELKGNAAVISFPLIPNCNDSVENLEKMVQFMLEIGITKINILPFHKLGLHEYEELGREYPVKEYAMLSQEKIASVKDFFTSKGMILAN